MLLLLLLTTSCAVIVVDATAKKRTLPTTDFLHDLFLIRGSSASVENLCYGKRLSFPTRYVPPLFRGQLYFTPSDGRPRKLLMDNKEAKDPRLVYLPGQGLLLMDLKESDSGTFSASDERTKNDTIFIVKILDCSYQLKKYYGKTYIFDVSRRAEFMEFTSLHTNQTKVLWNRSNPEASKGGRGEMKPGGWEIISLTTADSGYYNFRKKDNALLSRIRLTVEESFKHYNTNVNGRLLIQNSFFEGVSWTVTFTTNGTQASQTLLKAGKVVIKDDQISTSFSGRIWVIHDGIEIYPVKSTDAGTFKFSDPQGNLAQVVTVTVNPELTPTYVYVAIIGGIVLALFVCCCCVRKCCCKKSSSKRDQSAPDAVYYHEPDQPAGPSYSAAPAPDYSYQPVNPPAYGELAATSVGLSVNNPVNIHVNPRQPEVSAPGGQRATPAPSLGSDCLTSDHDTKFELKGVTFPSAPPLGSDSGFSDVYTSDKLNFL
ncbi:uncharacterized protein [Pagrus major]|uniref:uncharacterized protein n=1 Tax=Pagrus major TaxID=143350 RepID=UPI003CC8C7C0